MAQAGQLADRLRLTGAETEAVELDSAVGERVPDAAQVLCTGEQQGVGECAGGLVDYASSQS
jgi:hypothetical protein